MLGQSGPGSDGNEGVLCIPQSPSIIGTPPSDCLVLYPGLVVCVWGGYPSAEVQSVYSTTPANWGEKTIWQSVYIFIIDSFPS